MGILVGESTSLEMALDEKRPNNEVKSVWFRGGCKYIF
jgi:hypothetical protein